MRVCHSLILVFLALSEESTAFFNEDIGVRTGTEGENITVGCNFNFFGKRKIFCRDDCEKGNILVETTVVSNQTGRYSIEFNEGSYPPSTYLYVSITNLTKSDSGRYRCVLDRDWSPASSQMFELRVEDAPTTSKPNWTLQPFSTWTPSASTLHTTPSTPAAAPGVVLLVRLVLVIVVIVSSSAVLMFCRKKRTSKHEEPHVELDHVNITEGDQVYEEVREDDRQGGSPPVETSSV